MISGQTICAALGCPDAELSIVITGDAEIRELNRRWRGKDKPTDVLSFSQIEGGANGQKRRPAHVTDIRQLGPTPMLGDIVISADTATRQATNYGSSLAEEIDRLLVHGVLHLLGHDHVHGGHQARIMYEAEKPLLRRLRRLHRR